ncbi:MAG TPA: ATP-dependent protease, partial [Candidatus Bathyarchaeota archaeon]|nr:ATP-dependent protease [Candidatus Bathyarchaeota archaeon]
MVKAISYQEARKTCPTELVPYSSTEELEPLTDIIGQERALKALTFGLDIQEHGFNIFVAGLPGTGKKTAILTFLERKASEMPVPPDWCYVYNFEDKQKPKALSLPAGKGSQFVKDMERFVENMKKSLRAAFESEEYAEKREETLKKFETKKQELLKKVNQDAAEAGFALQRTQIGLLIIPVIDGKPISEQQFNMLPPKTREEIQRRREELQDELRSAFREIREVDRAAEAAVEKFNRGVAEFALEPLLEYLRERYGEYEGCAEYLDSVKKDILEN